MSKKVDPEIQAQKVALDRTMRFATKERIAEIDALTTEPIKNEKLKKSRLIIALRGRILHYIANNFMPINQYQGLFEAKNQLLTMIMYLTHENGGELRIPFGKKVKFSPNQYSLKYEFDAKNDEVVCKLEKIK